MSKISKKQLILRALSKYSDEVINSSNYSKTIIVRKSWWNIELNFPLNNRWKKTKKEKIIKYINWNLYNQERTESNKRMEWDTSSKNIFSIDIYLDGDIDDINLSTRIKKLRKEINKISFDDSNIITLIWPNWAGKSSILQEIFRKDIDSDDKNIIAFSSGQNELFSEIFNEHKRKNKRFLKEENIEIKSFYFNKDWVRFLIFLATILKDWKVREYLKTNNYVNIEYLFDISSTISFDFKISSKYIKTIDNEYQREIAWEFLEKLNRNTIYHRYLKKIISIYIDPDFDFLDNPNAIKNKKVKIDAKDFEEDFWNNINEILTFLVHTTNGNDKNIDLNSVELYFQNNLEFKQLSDWEYQLLGVYAIIDLFDKEKTLFLFDEIDSHLHYTNIKILWENLEKIKWKIITTTHIPDSIINNDINRLKLVEKWVINEDKTAKSIFDRLDSISDKEIYEIRLMRKIENIVIMDDFVDWLIFKKLVNKKLGKSAYEKLLNITFYKRSSSYNNTNEAFGKWKLLFVEDFFDTNKNNEIKTKNIFLICDRDKLPLTEIKEDLQVNIHNDFNKVKSKWHTKTHLLSWKRLEIENYLLWKELLQVNWCFPDYNYNTLKIDWKEDIAIFDCKYITHPIYKAEWFDEKKLDEIISKIPAEEISEDIEKMYDFIISKI